MFDEKMQKSDKFLNKFFCKKFTVLEADVGGINNVKPPSIQRRLRNIVAGLGARYLQVTHITT